MDSFNRLDSFSVTSNPVLHNDEITDVRLLYTAGRALKPNARLLLFYETRQHVGVVQNEQPENQNYISARKKTEAEEKPIEVYIHPLEFRSLDLHPTIPEFCVVSECRIGPDGLSKGDRVEIELRQWKAPKNPIKEFCFWLVVDAEAQWDLEPTGFRSYRVFVERESRKRIDPEKPLNTLCKASVEVQGLFPAVGEAQSRKTPGVFWGELHGMAFNQRPFEDFYEYGKNVTKLDFCAVEMFSYSTCAYDVWEKVVDTAKKYTQPGTFVAFAAFECGAPPDDSHRCAYFPNPDGVPPIFADSRPPANDPLYQARFHPDTIYCKTLDEFYDTVHGYGGFVCGHMHTLTYDRELLAEMWQKRMWPDNPFNEEEEERLYEILRSGKRMGIIAGSDTHDSMPGNPDPEFSMWIPGPNTDLEGPAGFTGVWAEELTPESLTEAFRARRVFATSGARIVVSFSSDGHPMGSELPASAERMFHIEADGTDTIATVELLKDGKPVNTWKPGTKTFSVDYVAEKAIEPSGVHVENSSTFYLVRVTQQDGYRAWTSPIWFG